ncbi:extracellular solute-binding protein [Paenibacillus ferrarius]|uniref:extracellular solute-binding protein n=1 Tax=Paenibacillus ferrarius TaxID=1469647 RepID=UPI003D2AF26C
MRKRNASMVLALTVILGTVAAGCGKADNSPSASSAAGQSPAASAGVDAAKYKISFFNSIGYRLTTPMPTKDQDPIRQMIEKDNNIDLDMVLGGESWKDKLNLLISSNQIPDVVSFPDRASAIKYYDQGLVADLDDVLKGFPDLLKSFDPSRLEPMKYKGHMIGIPASEGVGGVNGWWINNTWLKKLNLSVPTNPQELLNVMKAFTFNDPDGNGKNDTYGFVAMLPKDGSLGSNSGGNGFQQIFWMFGVQPNFVDVKDGKVVVYNSDPKMKEALQFIKDMIDAKVVDPDWVTIDDGLKRDNKMYQGKVGIMIEDWRRLEPAETKKMQDTGGSVPDWKQIAPPKGPYGDQILDTKPFQQSLIGISKEALKDPGKAKRAMAFIQYLYTNKDAYPYLAYGIKDKTFTMTNGQPKLIDKSTYNEKEVEWRYNYAFVRKANDGVYFDFKNPDVTNANQKINTSYLKDNNVNPRVFDDPSDAMAQDRLKYVNEMMLKFVTGKEPLSNWDAYVKTLQDKFKLNDAIANYTKQLQGDGIIK